MSSMPQQWLLLTMAILAPLACVIMQAIADATGLLQANSESGLPCLRSGLACLCWPRQAGWGVRHAAMLLVHDPPVAKTLSNMPC